MNYVKKWKKIKYMKLPCRKKKFNLKFKREFDTADFISLIITAFVCIFVIYSFI